MEYEIKIIHKEDDLFPNPLKQFKDCPKQLYAIGNVGLLETNIIAIVGSRNCTEYGSKTARKFSTELANNGITIISGMAVGIDTVAHIGALEEMGNTIAVLGGGFNDIFPPENVDLFHNIINNNGLVITEHEPSEQTKSENFPKRNRIISGLSLGVLVIEAGHRSGASLTATIATKQGKKVFCVPTNIDSKNSRTNKLIQKGAQIVFKPEDILIECGINFVKNHNTEVRLSCTTTNQHKTTTVMTEIPKEYLQVYKVLGYEPLHINEICKKTGNNISNVSSILTMLELDGNIEQLPGKRFRLM